VHGLLTGEEHFSDKLLEGQNDVKVLYKLVSMTVDDDPVKEKDESNFIHNAMI
jgi:hypothetical protein